MAQLDRRDEACLALERSQTLHPGFVQQRSAWRPYPDPAASYALSSGDRRRIGLATAEHFLIASEIGDIEPGWSPTLYAAGGSTHFMGSCRWGDVDDGCSVVDRNGAVWGTEGLYVADNSVIGTSNSGNPTFMTVAQCLRTADRILGR